MLGTLGTSWVGVDSITFPGMGGTGGQYVENTPEISKNQRFANFSIFLFGVQTSDFLKMVMCSS